MTLKKLFEAAIISVKPTSLINNFSNKILEHTQSKNVYFIGFGKAALGFLNPVSDILNRNIKLAILSVPEPTLSEKRLYPKLFNVPDDLKDVTTIYYGSRANISTDSVIEASKRIYNLISSVDKDDCLVVAITGGGSALLCYPERNINLADITNVTEILSKRGASIVEMNIVRKKLDVLKGGGICKHSKANNIISLILSDVVGDPLSIIASGPTVLDNSLDQAAIEVIRKYGLIDELSSDVLNCLQIKSKEAQIPESKSIYNFLIGNNRTALEAIVNKIEFQNKFISDSNNILRPYVLSDKLCSPPDFNEIASGLMNLFNSFFELVKSTKQMKSIESTVNIILQITDQLSLSRSVINKIINDLKSTMDNTINICLLLGGEIPVKVISNSNSVLDNNKIGQGGRCTHMALKLAILLNENQKINNYKDDLQIEVLCGATDGMDGALDCAGAIVDMTTVSMAAKQNLCALDYLNRFDSYNFFKKLSNGRNSLQTGLTGTNVMDVFIVCMTIRK